MLAEVRTSETNVASFHTDADNCNGQLMGLSLIDFRNNNFTQMLLVAILVGIDEARKTTCPFS